MCHMHQDLPVSHKIIFCAGSPPWSTHNRYTHASYKRLHTNHTCFHAEKQCYELHSQDQFWDWVIDAKYSNDLSVAHSIPEIRLLKVHKYVQCDCEKTVIIMSYALCVCLVITVLLPLHQAFHIYTIRIIEKNGRLVITLHAELFLVVFFDFRVSTGVGWDVVVNKLIRMFRLVCCFVAMSLFLVAII